LNFSGSPQDFPAEKQERIVEVLREITGNPDLQIVGSESGSFHLLLKARKADLAKFASPEVHRELKDKFGAELSGVMTEDEYRSARSNGDST
jgi:hypothetical protein